MKLLVLLLGGIAGCGRVGFGAIGDGAAGDGDSAVAAQPLIIPVSAGVGDPVVDIAFDSSGGFAVTGSYTQTLTLAGMSHTTTASQGFDIYAAGFDASGTPRWLWAGDASVAGSGQNLAWLPDARLYIVGYFAGVLAGASNVDAGGGQDALQVWLAPTGVLGDVKHAGGSANVQMRGLDTAGQQFVFGGIYSDTADFGAGALPTTGGGIDNAFVATGDVTAGVTTSRAFNGASDVYVNDVAIDAAGRMCVAGRFNTTTDFGGGPVSTGGSSGYVARYEAGFAFVWAREIASANVQSVAITPSGDCIAGGYANGNFAIDSFAVTNAGGNDGFALRFASSDGRAEWVRTFAGAGADTVFSLVLYDLDRVAIAGYFAGSAMVAGAAQVSEGANDGFIVGLDTDGTLLWTELLAGSGSIPDTLSGMDVDLAHRRLALGADFDGELRIGTATQTAAQVTGLALVLPLPP